MAPIRDVVLDGDEGGTVRQHVAKQQGCESVGNSRDQPGRPIHL